MGFFVFLGYKSLLNSLNSPNIRSEFEDNP